MGQESELGLIIKSYVALCSLCIIDNNFVAVLPKPLTDNATTLNSSGMLKMSKDYNTNKLIFNNLCKPQNRDSVTEYFIALVNI